MPVTPSPTRYVSVRALLKTWLTGTLGYENVTYRLPTNLTFTMPTVVVTRFGGAPDSNALTIDRANVDIDVLGADEDGTEAQAQHIHTMVRKTLPGFQYLGVVVAKTETISAPQERPFDSKASVWRQGGTYRLTLHQYGGL